ncbi:MAG: heme NO-binding domain-containing protein [Hyphomonas sp.]
MVHTAARSMVVETMGEAAWLNILQQADMDGEFFISGQNYSDDVTFALIDAVTKVSGFESTDLLKSFGRYWIGYTANSSYGTMFRIGGDRLDSFLLNLNRLHASVHSTMPASRMPSFELLRNENGRMDVLYTSDRTGLFPFVEGLLKGLMDHFGEAGHVTHATTHEGDIFSLHCTGKKAHSKAAQ